MDQFMFTLAFQSSQLCEWAHLKVWPWCVIALALCAYVFMSSPAELVGHSIFTLVFQNSRHCEWAHLVRPSIFPRSSQRFCFGSLYRPVKDAGVLSHGSF